MALWDHRVPPGTRGWKSHQPAPNHPGVPTRCFAASGRGRRGGLRTGSRTARHLAARRHAPVGLAHRGSRVVAVVRRDMMRPRLVTRHMERPPGGGAPGGPNSAAPCAGSRATVARLSVRLLPGRPLCGALAHRRDDQGPSSSHDRDDEAREPQVVADADLRPRHGEAERVGVSPEPHCPGRTHDLECDDRARGGPRWGGRPWRRPSVLSRFGL